MNIISCERCGVVLDKDVLPFAGVHSMEREDGTVNCELFAWSNKADDYIAKVPCPVCEEEVLNE